MTRLAFNDPEEKCKSSLLSSSHRPEAPGEPQQHRLRNVTAPMAGFVTGDGLCLASSPRSAPSGRSDASVLNKATRARIKDEKATVAIGGQFMNHVHIFKPVEPQGGRNAVEDCAAGD